MPKLVILVSGFKRAGKDYVSSLLAEQLRGLYLTVESESFAAPMKRIISATFGISLEDLEDYKNNTDNYILELADEKHECHALQTDFRSILQNFGSEAMKPEFGDNVWSELMVNRIKQSTADIVIIPDYRFDSELDHLRNSDINTVSIHISNGVVATEDMHVSEVLPTNPPSFIIDNSAQDDTVQAEVEHCMDYLKALL